MPNKLAIDKLAVAKALQVVLVLASRAQVGMSEAPAALAAVDLVRAFAKELVAPEGTGNGA